MPRLAGSHADVATEDPNKRAKLLLAVLGVVVVVAAIFWFLVKPAISKSSDDTSASSSTPPPVTAPKAAAKPSPSPSASPTPPVGADDFSGSTRDPFAPLPAENVAATTGASGLTGSSATAAPLPSVTADPSPSASASAASAHTLTLVAVTGTSADVTADGKDKTVKAGDTITAGLACVKVTEDSIFVTYQSKAYALAPGQTISFPSGGS